jgi:hypothetical protein
MVIFALYLACVRDAMVNGTAWTAAVSIVGAFVMTCFAMFAIVFAIAWPVGLLEKYFTEVIEPPRSPFASDRLPDQLATPSGDEIE